MSTKQNHRFAIKLLNEVFADIIAMAPDVQKANYKKLFHENIQNHDTYTDAIAFNLRWGETSKKYLYVCCHLESDKLVFPHNITAKTIPLNTLAQDIAILHTNFAILLAEPLWVDKTWKPLLEKLNKNSESASNTTNVGKGSFPLNISLFLAESTYKAGQESQRSSALTPFMEESLLKAQIEACEWESIAWQNNKVQVDNMTNKPKVDPKAFNANFSKHDRINHWTKSTHLQTNKAAYVPSQLIYSQYQFEKDEFVLRTPISTGASAQFNVKKAIETGITELIERDHFALYYVTGTSPIVINVSSNSKLSQLFNSIQNATSSDMSILDFSYDSPLNVVGVFIVNENQKQAALGLGANRNIEDAIICAILEALKIFQSASVKEPVKQSVKPNESTLRSLFMSNKNIWKQEFPISEIKFLTQGEERGIENYEPSQTTLDDYLKKANIDVYYIKMAKRNPAIHVIKTISPQLLPVPIALSKSWYSKERIQKFSMTKNTYTATAPSVPPPFF